MLQPAEPYVCIGYHQDPIKEIDLEYCKERSLAIIRRSQGGGATILDRDQVFYQIIGKDTPVIPRDVDEMFKNLLGVTVDTYQRMGLDAEYKPLNDVISNGKKISGNGAGLHETASILVGNIILDLPYEEMAKILKVPDEKFRDKMAKSMMEWVTNLRRERGKAPSPSIVKKTYTQCFQELLGVELEEAQPTSLEWNIFEAETKPRHTSKEWLYLHSKPLDEKVGRGVKIAGDIKVVETDHKARKLIRIYSEIQGGVLKDIKITGDFFAIPKESIITLEAMLEDVTLDESMVREVVNQFYEESKANIPGIKPDDFVEAVMKIKGYI
jgi:lipoate-protein ligase A